MSANVIPTPSRVPQPTPHELLMEAIRQQHPADVSALQEQLHAVWKNMSYIALSVLLGKTSPLHVKIVGCSCVRLRDAIIDALPIRFAQPPPPPKPQPMLSVSAPADDEPGDDCCATCRRPNAKILCKQCGVAKFCNAKCRRKGAKWHKLGCLKLDLVKRSSVVRTAVDNGDWDRAFKYAHEGVDVAKLVSVILLTHPTPTLSHPFSELPNPCARHHPCSIVPASHHCCNLWFPLSFELVCPLYAKYYHAMLLRLLETT